MIGKARGSHTSPGVYTREVDITYAVKSLGITTLGVVGETEKGPAFEPIKIEDWSEFQTYFGGTNPAKFKESGYPKYELPYIAKSYLKESKQLEVCRVLGLSGYNAGPAWLLTIGGYVVAVLRSRGHYRKYDYTKSETTGCVNGYKYDSLTYVCSSITISDSFANVINPNCDVFTNEANPLDRNSTIDNLGRFTLTIDDISYAVSLNPGDKNYIINVFGTSNDDGNAPVFVEELYDVALLQMVYNGYIKPTDEFSIQKVDANAISPVCAPVDGILEVKEPTRSMVGKTYLAIEDDKTIVIGEKQKIDATTKEPVFEKKTDKDGA